MQYTGRLTNGKVFDSTENPGRSAVSQNRNMFQSLTFHNIHSSRSLSVSARSSGDGMRAWLGAAKEKSSP